MGCSSCREHLSADLDGEADPTALAVARTHLAGCSECAIWFERATQVNRLLRTAPADPGPGMTTDQLAGVLEHLPKPRPRLLWFRQAARWALAGVGIVQAALATFALLLPDSAAGQVANHAHGGHTGPAPEASMPEPSMLGAGMEHMSRESAAWNLALGVAFVAGAIWIRHLAGLLPVLGCFVPVLFLVSAVDLVQGHVDAGRVAAHALVAGGLGLIALIVATGPSEFRPHPARGDADADAEPRWAEEGPSVPRLAPRRRRRPGPAAHREVA